ncbi:MAG: MipA/OmpV family protein [Phycisphaerales bacterium]|nr:MipA/OmpV family protein [Phycisphaerales bacterium]
MRSTIKYRLAILLWAAAWLPMAASAQAPSLANILPNFIGIGVGVTPQYIGSDHYVGGVAPAGFYKFDSERFISYTGVVGEANLLDSPNWRFGPAFGYRLGRNDVDDDVVDRLEKIDDTVEGGLTFSYAYLNEGQTPWNLRVGISGVTGLAGGDSYSGIHTTGFASLWVPLSERLIIGTGLGVTYDSSDFMQTYFGVSARGSAASGLPMFDPDSGFSSAYIWPAVIYKINEHWFGGAGMFYKRLLNDAADSPIVKRGSQNQLTGGLGVAYYWE